MNPTLTQIIRSLPEGFHDAWLENMRIDWMKNTITLEMNIWLGGRTPEGKIAETRRKGILVLREVQSIIFENQPFKDFQEEDGAWIDIGTNFPFDEYPPEFNRTEHSGWIFFFSKSATLYFTALNADFKWNDDNP